MKTTIVFFLFLMSSVSMANSEVVKVGCIFEKENFTQVHRIFELKTKSDGKDAIFLSISPDFSKVVEVNNDEDKLSEIQKDDIAVAIFAINSVEISMAMGSVLETFTPQNLGEVITIGETSSPVKVDFISASSGQLKLGMSLLKDNVKALCQIRNSSWLDSLVP